VYDGDIFIRTIILSVVFVFIALVGYIMYKFIIKKSDDK
jgi:hypothetical protein